MNKQFIELTFYQERRGLRREVEVVVVGPGGGYLVCCATRRNSSLNWKRKTASLRLGPYDGPIRIVIPLGRCVFVLTPERILLNFLTAGI